MFIFIELCMKGDPLVRIKGKQLTKSVLEVGNVQMVGWQLAPHFLLCYVLKFELFYFSSNFNAFCVCVQNVRFYELFMSQYRK
jgi:hypothetical protein